MRPAVVGRCDGPVLFLAGGILQENRELSAVP